MVGEKDLQYFRCQLCVEAVHRYLDTLFEHEVLPLPPPTEATCTHKPRFVPFAGKTGNAFSSRDSDSTSVKAVMPHCLNFSSNGRGQLL